MAEPHHLKRLDERYRAYLSDRGLKTTVQRDMIVARFFRTREHLTAEELYAQVRREHPSIGLATVYRTLRILADARLAHEHRFNDGVTRYEPIGPGNEHHDHLVCEACGRVEEFSNDEIEELQERVARTHGFVIRHHSLELYGLCGRCAGTTQGDDHPIA